MDRTTDGRYVNIGISERLWTEWAKLVGVKTLALQFVDHQILGRCNKMGPIGKRGLIGYLDEKDVQPGRQGILLALGITPRLIRGKIGNWFSNIGILEREDSILVCPHCHRYSPTLTHGIQQTIEAVSGQGWSITLPVQCLSCGREYDQRLVIRDPKESPEVTA